MTEDNDGNKVVHLKTKKPVEFHRASEKKWGKAVVKLGFSIVPSLLLQAQKRLNITPVQMTILMHLADIWWNAEQNPFPSKATLSERIGLSERQIQRVIKELEEAGYVERIGRTAISKGKISNEYDLSGLVKRLKQIEPEFTALREEKRMRKRALTSRGLKKRVVEE